MVIISHSYAYKARIYPIPVNEWQCECNAVIQNYELSRKKNYKKEKKLTKGEI